MEAAVRVWDTATVWDREIVGMLGAAQSLETGEQTLILADSKAAISAVKRAGRTGKVRTRDLKKLLEVFEGRKEARVGLG